MKKQFRVLYREFLFRVVDLELLAPQGDIAKLLGQFAAVLLFQSFALSLRAMFVSCDFKTSTMSEGSSVHRGKNISLVCDLCP